MYALVDILGKQYKVEQGSVLRVDHVPQEKGTAVEFPSVLMVSDAGAVKLGSPYLAGVSVRAVVEFPSVLMVSDAGSVRLGSPYISGVSVRAVVEDHGRGAKVLVGKYRKKKNYRRRQGHRQQYSTIKIEGFNGLG